MTRLVAQLAERVTVHILLALTPTVTLVIMTTLQSGAKLIIIFIIIIMQRLTRHVSAIRLTNRRRGVTWIYG